MMMNDPELSFKELKEKYPQMGVPPPGAFTTRPKGEGKKKKKPAKPAAALKTGQNPAAKGADVADMVELIRPPSATGVKTEAVPPPGTLENGVKAEQAEEVESTSIKVEKTDEIPNKIKHLGDVPIKQETADNIVPMRLDNSGHTPQDVKPAVEPTDGTPGGDSKDLQDGSQDREGFMKAEVKKEVVGVDGTPGTTADGTHPTRAENGEVLPKVPVPAKQMSEAEILYTYILRWPKVGSFR